VESLISLKRDVKLDAKRDGERDAKRDVIGGEMSDIIEVKVRGAPNMEKECFFFLEEILGVIDQVKKSFLKLSKMFFSSKSFSFEQKGVEKVNAS
jgi:hypothetical protein